MWRIITFGHFKEYDVKQYREDKERFYESKSNLLAFLLLGYPAPEDLEEEQIANMDSIIKKKLSENLKNIDYYLGSFFEDLGIKYGLLSTQVKKELLTFDYTYENCKNFVQKLYNEIIDESKKYLPIEAYICLEEKGFIYYSQIYKKTKIKKNNFVEFIRDYFILDKAKKRLSYYRDQQLFDEVRMKMIDIYPFLKDNYGTNRKLDLFLSYFDEDNDYNNKFLKYILNNYYENKDKKVNNKYMPIEQNDN